MRRALHIQPQIVCSTATKCPRNLIWLCYLCGTAEKHALHSPTMVSKHTLSSIVLGSTGPQVSLLQCSKKSCKTKSLLYLHNWKTNFSMPCFLQVKCTVDLAIKLKLWLVASAFSMQEQASYWHDEVSLDNAESVLPQRTIPKWRIYTVLPQLCDTILGCFLQGRWSSNNCLKW